MPNDVPLDASASHVQADRIHSDPDSIENAATVNNTEVLADRSMLDHMVRRPTEADFADVLTPEGNSGDIVGSDVSDGIGPSNDSLGGT
ncbi:MAG: hypothetical protein V4671_12685 [Armatimonadota bacterium]